MRILPDAIFPDSGLQANQETPLSSTFWSLLFLTFITFVELDVVGTLSHYSDVSERAALLSNVRLYVLSFPWMAFYPALAFLIAILGFNLISDGIRRMVVGVGVRISHLIDRFTFLLQQ